MASLWQMFNKDVPDLMQDEIAQTGKGRLELLYSSALLSSKENLDHQIVQALQPGSPHQEEEAPSPQEAVTPRRHIERRPRRRSTLLSGTDYQCVEIPDGDVEDEEPLDYFSNTNADSFNVGMRPVRTVRWRPPRTGDPRRRPGVPLEQDFDSPSESEEEEAPLQEHVVGSYKAKAQKSEIMHEMKMKTLPAPGQKPEAAGWTSYCGPHCCLDHAAAAGRQAARLLEGIRSLHVSAMPTAKGAPPTMPYKLEHEEDVVEELRLVRERQQKLAVSKPSGRTAQRAS